jgi:hypothetical protein
MTDKTAPRTGMIHANEDEMRAAGDGVFAKRAADRTVGPTQKRVAEAAENKAMKAAPSNKAEGSSLSSMTKAELIEEPSRRCRRNRRQQGGLGRQA